MQNPSEKSLKTSPEGFPSSPAPGNVKKKAAREGFAGDGLKSLAFTAEDRLDFTRSVDGKLSGLLTYSFFVGSPVSR
jgi:hypothetical protein